MVNTTYITAKKTVVMERIATVRENFSKLRVPSNISDSISYVRVTDNKDLTILGIAQIC